MCWIASRGPAMCMLYGRYAQRSRGLFTSAASTSYVRYRTMPGMSSSYSSIQASVHASSAAPFVGSTRHRLALHPHISASLRPTDHTRNQVIIAICTHKGTPERAHIPALVQCFNFA